MLIKRIFSSIVLVTIAILSLKVNWVFGLAITLLVIGGLYEFFILIEKKGIYIYKYLGIAIGAIIPLSIYFKFELTKGWELLFIVLSFISLIILQFRRQDNSNAVVSISTTVFGILYIAWFFSFLIKIKYLPNGIYLISALIFITKAGDIGSYLVGTRWGKTPLISRISPKKSVEGSVGGIVFSILAALSSRILLPFSYLHLLTIGAFLGALGQLGDLSESLIKRDCQVKDSANIFPGLGGILDVIDSILFTAPAFYFYMSVILNKNL